MGIFHNIKSALAVSRQTDEYFYAEALREIECGIRKDGIWAKAMAESDMDQGKAAARYIKLRVQSLKDEVTLQSTIDIELINENSALPTQSLPIAEFTDVICQKQQVTRDSQVLAEKNPIASTANAAFMKLLTPSADLALIIGKESLPRTEVVQKLWKYIKENNLQNEVNKRIINADSKLLNVFGKPQVSMFEMAGLIGKHLK